MTFSVACWDSASGAVGIATATGMPAVGGFVPHLQSNAGAIATQGFSTSRLYGADGLGLLARGWSAPEVVDALSRRDRGSEWRQCIIIDARGQTAAFSGDRNEPVVAVRHEEHAVFGGNMLTSEAVVEAMAAAFAARKEAYLADRMLAALLAAEDAGGDKRGACSAALMVEHPGGQRVDLRIDDHPAPVSALEQLLARMREPEVRAFLERLPTRADPHRA